MKFSIQCTVIGLAGILLWANAFGQHPFQHRLAVLSGDYSDLPDQTATNGPEFGYSVDISGSWMAVGAPGTIIDSTGNPDGAVFLFREVDGAWQLEQRLTAASSSLATEARCGTSVSLQGGHLAVGCPGDQTGGDVGPLEAGLMRLYRFDGASGEWQVQIAASGPDFARCGTDVSIAVTPITIPALATAVSGCPQHNNSQGQVRVYSFDGSDWSFNTTITSSDGTSGDTFGAAVALHRSCTFLPTPSCLTRLAVGAPTKQHGTSFLAGSAYVFDGSWNQTHSFTHLSPDSFGLTLFGIAVDINATQLVIGSSGGLTGDCPNTPNVPRCGLARHWEFDNGNWNVSSVATAVNVDGAPSGEQQGMAFGRAVALGHDNWIAVAAPMTDRPDSDGDTVADLGMVELRRNNNGAWSAGHYQGEIDPLVGTVFDQSDTRFGTSVAFGGGRWLAVGHPRVKIGRFEGVRRGLVYMYAVPDGIFADRFEE
jgi:hypothetical protein